VPADQRGTLASGRDPRRSGERAGGPQAIPTAISSAEKLAVGLVNAQPGLVPHADHFRYAAFRVGCGVGANSRTRPKWRALAILL